MKDSSKWLTAKLVLPLIGLQWLTPATAAEQNPTFNSPATSVQMFQWRWNDVARECREAIGPIGYGAVQISPAQSSKIYDAWWDVYQPVDFTSLTSKFGTEAELKEMIASCHGAGVRIYADIVSNQMAGDSSNWFKSTSGQSWSAGDLVYPRFSKADFNDYCEITAQDYDSDRNTVINCRLNQLPDLKTSSPYVQNEIANYMKKLLSLGVDGFRMDAAKHQPPEDINSILKKVLSAYPKTLANEKVWITQEIIPDKTVNREAYYKNGTVNEFLYTVALKETFRKENGKTLSSIPSIMGMPGNWGGSWYLMPSAQATVFVNNWDTERHPTTSLNASNNSYNDRYYSKRYDLANIFMLAWPYGEAQVHSGFKFSDEQGDSPKTSPYGRDGRPDNSKWDFIHRWDGIANMVKFRSAAGVTGVNNWVTGSDNQIAFSRGAMGFVALNNDTSTWRKNFNTGMPAGKYCDIIKLGLFAEKVSCPGNEINVDQYGNASLTIPPNDGVALPAVVIYSGSKVL
jgi:alpha-amylase